jgi:hypothetical protein
MADTTITITRQQLQEMIDTAIEQHADALAARPNGNTTDPLQYEKIGEAVATGMAKNTRRKVTYGEYIKRTHSAMHPDPAWPNGPPLKRQTWINGDHLDQVGTLDKEINLLNQITHSGRYINRLVEVLVRQEGLDEVLEIRYNNTKDSELPNHSRNLIDTLSQIVEAQKIEREEEEITQEARKEARRMFGNAKATREARERAGV